MATKSSGKLAATEHMRAMKAARADELAGQVDPAVEARVRERKLLDGLGVAADDLEWLATNQAWVLLGHDTCAAWWEDRVKPVAESLGFQPTRELGMRFVELIRAEEMTLPPAQRRSTKELALFVGVSEWAARGRKETRQRRSAPHVDLAGRPALEGSWTEEDTTETSGAVPPASTVDASLALGEPDVDEQAASTSGTQTAAGPEVEVAPSPADETAAGTAASAGRAGGQTPARPVPTDSPAADSLPPQAHAGVPAVGGQTEERTEEQIGPWDVVWTSVGNDAEIDRQTFGSYQLAVAEMERSRRAGSIAEVDIEPTPTDSPTGLEAAQPREGRSETDSSAGPDQPVATTVLPGIDHHDGAGVSLSGEALPVESRPAGALLEDGDAAVMTSSSSSDPDDEEDDDRPYVTPRDALMAAFGTLADYLALVDTDVVGPQLKEADMPTLFDHTEVFETFVRRLGKARFAEMTRTP